MDKYIHIFYHKFYWLQVWFLVLKKYQKFFLKKFFYINYITYLYQTRLRFKLIGMGYMFQKRTLSLLLFANYSHLLEISLKTNSFEIQTKGQKTKYLILRCLTTSFFIQLFGLQLLNLLKKNNYIQKGLFFFREYYVFKEGKKKFAT